MEDPIPTFSYLVSQIHDLYPNFGYLHVVEPRVCGYDDIDPGTDSNDFLRDIWLPKAFISAGGYNRESAIEMADKTGELIAFGRSFISNVRY
jgi:NADPH2 dehydrogenase